MRETRADGRVVTREEVRDEAPCALPLRSASTYKVEIIAGIPRTGPISLYTQGDFTDLCRGPHVQSTGRSARSS